GGSYLRHSCLWRCGGDDPPFGSHYLLDVDLVVHRGVTSGHASLLQQHHVLPEDTTLPSCTVTIHPRAFTRTRSYLRSWRRRQPVAHCVAHRSRHDSGDFYR